MDSKVMYGQEHGRNLIKICKRLLDNQNLINLLVNTDKDPLSHNDISDPMQEIFNKYIVVVPMTVKEDETNKSKVAILFESGAPQSGNYDNEGIDFTVFIYCPFSTWLITGDTLRPFAIMSEIRKSLQDKKINGLGTINYRGFQLSSITEEMSCYTMRFEINAFT